MTDHRKGVALITGANKGIGFETARQLGLQQFVVLIGARDPTLGEPAAKKLAEMGMDARFIRLDVTDDATIHAAAHEIEDTFGRLDVLVNNAGTGSPSDAPPSKADLSEVRRVFEVNFFGALAVTQAMLPLLRKSSAGRIVNVSSGLGSLTHHSDPDWEFGQVQMIGYNGSKAALNMATVLLAKELRDTSIKVNSVSPGFTATDLNGGGPGAQSVEEGATASVLTALLPDSGRTGGFMGRDGPEPW